MLTAMGGLDFAGFEVLTFDCYGTLIDWERGILDALRPVFDGHGTAATDDEILHAFANNEATLEAGPYLSYREILTQSLQRLGRDFGFAVSEDEAIQFGASVQNWPAFEDSAASLRDLGRRFKLGVITNCDDDLFAFSSRRLEARFDWITTAQQARSYKPSLNNFRVAFEQIRIPKEQILHVAQSLHHDHVPAKQLGMTTAWIDRRHDKPGFGATPAAAASPDLAVTDMKSFAGLALAGWMDSAH